MMLPILIFAIGNESRGDDALAPLLLRELQSRRIPEVELIEEYQLQVEHVTDLTGCDRVLFIDADLSCAEPYEFTEISAEKDGSYTSHALNPTALLHAYRQVYRKDAPPAFLLRIRGYRFELGDPLSEQAAANLQSATGLVRVLSAGASLQRWRACAMNAGYAEME